MQINRITHPQPLRTLLGCALLGFVTVLSLLWLAVDSSRAGDGLPGGPMAGEAPSAQASTVKSLDEIMHMRIKKVKGKRVSAKGRATGTVAGKGSFNLVLSNGSSAAATFYGHNAHGTISGTGVAGYRVSGAISYYSGRVTSLHGTGRYAHASTRGIRFSGSVNRRTYEVKMHLQGKWHV